MRIVWSGVHERRKALEAILYTLLVLPETDVLDVLGEGCETARWKRLAKRLGVADRITWHGWLSKDKAQDVVAKADTFVITSLRDLTSTVLLEALAAGKPVVCLDHCGFSDVVDETCGIKIPVGKPKDVIRSFAEALRNLQDEALRKRLSDGTKKRAAEYAWAKKQSVINQLYLPSWRKVLVCVYTCSPYRGSEPGMGWNYLRLIATGREVWAIVEQEKWEVDIKRWLSGHPNEMQNVHFVFIRKPRCRWLRRIWPPSYYWFYRVWHWRAYKTAQRLHKEIGFDCVHQLNMVGFREPGYMWKLPIPFIWGPIGGLGQTDWRLLGLLPFAGKIEFFFRNIINWCHSHFLLRPKLAARKASRTGTFITATSENQREAKRLWEVDSTVLCEVGT